jgi:quercetin dioxygenase-like cupin family protein
LRRGITLAFLGSFAMALATAAQTPQSTADTHPIMTPATLKWGEAPPALPKGSLMAVLSGDPGKPGPFTLRAKMPAGYTIPPHWHPTDEHLTLISGEVAVGMGEKFDAAAMKTLPAGGFVVMPAEMRHYLRVKRPSILQVHGIGPLTITYVNPADDPRQAAPKTQ